MPYQHTFVCTWTAKATAKLLLSFLVLSPVVARDLPLLPIIQVPIAGDFPTVGGEGEGRGREIGLDSGARDPSGSGVAGEDFVYPKVDYSFAS